MIYGLLAGIAGCGVLAFAVAWRLDTAFQPFDEAFSDFSEADCRATDADLVQQLRAVEGTCCEVGIVSHSHSTSEAR